MLQNTSNDKYYAFSFLQDLETKLTIWFDFNYKFLSSDKMHINRILNPQQASESTAGKNWEFKFVRCIDDKHFFTIFWIRKRQMIRYLSRTGSPNLLFMSISTRSFYFKTFLLSSQHKLINFFGSGVKQHFYHISKWVLIYIMWEPMYYVQSINWYLNFKFHQFRYTHSHSESTTDDHGLSCHDHNFSI